MGKINLDLKEPCRKCGAKMVHRPSEDQHEFARQFRCRNCDHGVIVVMAETAHIGGAKLVIPPEKKFVDFGKNVKWRSQQTPN